MTDITQRLNFNASGAIRTLGTLKGKLNEGTTALKQFKDAADKVGGTGKAGKTLKNEGEAADKTAKKVNSLTVSWKTMVRVIQTQIALRALNGVINGLEDATERARDLGLAIAEVQTIGSGLGSSTGKLTDDILALSDAIGKTPKDLAEGLYQTLSNQVVDAGDAFEFNAEAAKLATIAVSDQKSAINALSSVLNSYGKSAGDAAYISGTLFKTVEYGRLRLSDIGDILGRVLPLSSKLGIKWEEVAAAVATMTRQGVKADTALTQLRAIFQQLIRPGDKLKALMNNEWGVPNAEAAFKAFGGFPGVMQKIAKETKGDTEAVGDLFRRVRAVAGYFGTMTEEGDQLTDTLGKIKGEAGDASKVFNEFTQTDAFKLTQQMQIFENQWTRLGNTTMPLVNSLITKINGLMENTAITWKIITGQINSSSRAANTYKSVQESIKRKVKEINDEYQKNPPGKQYEDALSEANKYYSEINRQEANLERIRDNGIASANAKLAATNDRIIGSLKDGAKELKKFLDDAAKLAENTAKDIGKVQQDIDKRTLDNRLQNAKTVAGKLRIIDQQLAKARAKVAKTFGDISADPATKKAFKDAVDAAVKLADQGASIAKNQRTRNKYSQEAIGFLESEKKGVRTYADEVKKATAGAKKQYDAIKDGEKQASTLLEKRTGLLKESIRQGTSEKRKADIAKEIGGLDKQLKAVFEKANIGDALIKSLNLDAAYGTLGAGLTETLNNATKDWNAEVERMKAAFAKAIIPIKVSIEKVASITDVGKQLGTNIRPGESQGQFASRVGDEALKVIQKQGEQQRKNAIAQAKVATNEKANAINLRGIYAETNAQIAEALDSRRRKIVKANKGQISEVEALRQANLQLNKDMESGSLPLYKRWKTMQDMNAEMKELSARSNKAEKVETSVYQAMNRRLAQMAAAGTISRDAAEAWARLLPQFQKQNAQAVTNGSAIVPIDEEKLAIAKAYLDNLNKGTDAIKEAKTPSEQLKTSLENAKPAAQNLSTETANTSNNTQNAAGAMSAVGSAASAAQPAVAALTQQTSKLADQAERAARAQSAASGGSGVTRTRTPGGGEMVTNPFFKWHGGRPKYFAHGGRGQDRIPAMLARGETVINRRNSLRFFSELNAMNQGSQPVYREQGGTVTNVGDINVTVNGGDSSQQTVREIGRALRRDVQRGNIKLR